VPDEAVAQADAATARRASRGFIGGRGGGRRWAACGRRRGCRR
jgi:hypothetical protein